MVWGLPPERAGRAPQASRHSNSADVVVARRAVVLAEAESIRVVLEQALTMAVTPTPPASPSS
jgi:hypothetical protein